MNLDEVSSCGLNCSSCSRKMKVKIDHYQMDVHGDISYLA